MSQFFEFDTLSLHAGQTVDGEYGARATPIYQTSSYVFPDTDTAASIFNLERGGHAYSRITNPTVAVNAVIAGQYGIRPSLKVGRGYLNGTVKEIEEM